MYKHFFKRIIDFILSFTGLIILSPVFIIVTILLFFANNGKPFFFQQRPGKNEKIFKIIKFKTMNDRKDENEMARVVITDLFNFAMPMIRYDTGDLAIFCYKVKSGTKRRIICSIEGRKVDSVYDVNGKMISPHAVSYTIWRFPDLLQWQFHQTGQRNYKLLINGEFTNVDKSSLETQLQDLLGKEADIAFEFVNDIPALASGKRKIIVNNYKK